MDSVLESVAYIKALAIAKERHDGKVDDFGAPYYQHFERVARKLVEIFSSATDAQIQAALLHDVYEPDMSYTDAYHINAMRDLSLSTQTTTQILKNDVYQCGLASMD